MQQLDLFGMPVEPVAAPVKKSKPVAPPQEKEPVKEPAASVPAPVAVIEEEAIPVASLPHNPLTPEEPAVAPVQPVAAMERQDVPATPVFNTPPSPATPTQEEPVVFADERIVVKIKQRTAPASVPAPPEKKEEPIIAPLTETSVATTSSLSKQPGKRGRKSFKEIDSEVDLIEVPDEDTLQQKLYYSISEVAGWFKVNTSLLRYWENEFDVLKPRKTRKGDRLFRVEDIRNLQLIYFLLRQRKLSIEGARNYLKQHRQQADVQVQLVQSLTRFKSFLLELKAGL